MKEIIMRVLFNIYEKYIETYIKSPSRICCY